MPETSVNFGALNCLSKRAARRVTATIRLLVAIAVATLSAQRHIKAEGDPGAVPARLDLRELTDQEALSALETIAEASRENFARLQTFEAKYTIEDRSNVSAEKLQRLKYELPESPGPWQERDTGTVILRYDAASERIYSEIEMKLCSLVRDATGKKMKHDLPLPIPQRAIVTPSHFYYFPFRSKYADFREVPAITGEVGHVAFRKPIEEADRQKHAMVVDPRDFFGYSGLFADEIERLVGALKAEMNGTAGKPLGAPDRVIRVRSVGQGEGHVFAIIFSMWPGGVTSADSPGQAQFVIRVPRNVGYNCTDLSVEKQGVNVEVVNWGYKRVSDVWIPFKMGRALFDPKTRQLTNDRVLVLESCEVNGELPDASLSLSALGLADGERVLDYVEEMCYRYKGGELVGGVSFHSPPSVQFDNQASSWPVPFWAIAIGNLVLIAMLTAFLTWRRGARM